MLRASRLSRASLALFERRRPTWDFKERLVHLIFFSRHSDLTQINVPCSFSLISGLDCYCSQVHMDAFVSPLGRHGYGPTVSLQHLRC